MADGRERQAPYNCADQRAITWLQRAEVCADLLALVAGAGPARTSLADIGCGDQKLRQVLRARALPFDYQGYDLLPQAPEVERFDVRTEPLPRRHGVAVVLGVIEYLDDLPAVLARLARQVPHLVVSHAVRQGETYSAERLRELGWINHLTADELVVCLQDAGCEVVERRFAADGRTLVALCMSRVSRVVP